MLNNRGHAHAGSMATQLRPPLACRGPRRNPGSHNTTQHPLSGFLGHEASQWWGDRESSRWHHETLMDCDHSFKATSNTAAKGGSAAANAGSEAVTSKTCSQDKQKRLQPHAEPMLRESEASPVASTIQGMQG